ncbi:MAG: flagellar protein FlaG [Gammaproteobacteria bacterium]
MASEFDNIGAHPLRLPEDVSPATVPRVNASLTHNDSRPGSATVKHGGGGEAAQAQATTARPVDKAELQNTADYLNEAMSRFRHALEFSVDDSTQRTIIVVKNPESGEVIRQIPHEESLRLVREIKDMELSEREGTGGTKAHFLVDELC